ncbi:MAG TPA: PP0621 family protein [Burkholderiales bacterium]|nr:PP0621 family protein [Burkholderiales bacterium]
MAKIILLVLGLLLVYWILKGYRRGIERRGTAPPARGGEDMVRCAHCGVHLPRSESLTTQGEFFCTPDHQREHERR